MKCYMMSVIFEKYNLRSKMVRTFTYSCDFENFVDINLVWLLRDTLRLVAINVALQPSLDNTLDAILVLLLKNAFIFRKIALL